MMWGPRRRGEIGYYIVQPETTGLRARGERGMVNVPVLHPLPFSVDADALGLLTYDLADTKWSCSNNCSNHSAPCVETQVINGGCARKYK